MGWVKAKWRTLAVLFAVALASSGLTVAVAGAATPSPVYICQDFTSCQNGQYLEVFDHNGAPIFSVGQTGGADVFGDDFRLFGHDDPFDPEIVITDKPLPATCKAPERWINVSGSWTCRNGLWAKS